VPDRISDPWGSRAPYGAGQPWPVRVDQHLAEGVDEADVERWAESASVLDSNGDGIEARAANELTLTSWDPVSKQPVFKVAAVRVEG
jgi:hypothetical protein